MKVRMTLVADMEVAPQEAFERYGTTDVYRLAARLQHELDEKLVKDLKHLSAQGYRAASVKVEPLSA